MATIKEHIYNKIVAAAKEGNQALVESAITSLGIEGEYGRKTFLNIWLLQAAEQGEAAPAQALIKAGADVDAKGGESFIHTPLHKAASKGHEEVVKVLLDAGADVNARDEHQRTPLHLVDSEDMELIADLDKDGNQVIEDGKPQMLMVAAYRKTAKMLLDAGAEVNALDVFQYTPLHVFVAQAGHTLLIPMMLDAGADINLEKGYADWSSESHEAFVKHMASKDRQHELLNIYNEHYDILDQEQQAAWDKYFSSATMRRENIEIPKGSAVAKYSGTSSQQTGRIP